MKKLKLLPLLLLFISLLPSCNKEDSDETKGIGTIEFAIVMPSSTNVKSSDNVSKLIVSISTIDGETIFSKKELKVFNMNGYYIAGPLSLSNGEYLLTEFFVVDDSNNIIYASPKSDSELAYLVNDPLDIEFKINNDEVLKLSPEVISAEGFDPEDFGYATFSFTVREFFDFSISTFIYNKVVKNMELSSSNIEISSDKSILYSGKLKAETNTVRINDGYSNYDIKITKEGYNNFIYSYSVDSIKYYQIDKGNGPLKIVLVEKSDASTTPIEYITVEGGTFQMGDEFGVGQSDELPIHTVTVSTFQISKYEITQAQFIDFLNSVGCNSDGTFTDEEFGLVNYIVNMDEDYCPVGYSEDSFYFKGSINVPTIDCPATCVSWYGANAFCEWAGGRLPYEAEWEFAARGGNLSEGYKYSGSNNYNDVAWNTYNSGEIAHPVGEKQANELGIYDMSGNAWEWCMDWYGDYSSQSQTNPKGPETGESRVGRGAGYLSNDLSCRVANRHDNNPVNLVTLRAHGIRIVKEVN